MDEKGSTECATEFFTDCVKLLTKHRSIYDFQLTRFLTERIWEQVPQNWLPVLRSLTTDQLNQVPFGYCQDSWPDSLKQFLQTAISLSLPRSLPGGSTVITLDEKMTHGMSPKKRHEVCHVAALVDRVCQQNTCSGVVDVGSGLGYLSLLLSDKLGYKVLGIECEESRCQGADLRTAKLMPDQLTNFKSQSFLLKDELASHEKFRKLLHDYFAKAHLCDCQCTSESTQFDDPEPRHHRCNSDADGPPSVSQITNTKSEQCESATISNAGLSTVQCVYNYTLTTTHRTDEVPGNCSDSVSDATLITGHCSNGVSDATLPTGHLSDKASDASSPTGHCSDRVSGATPTNTPGLCLIGLHCCGDLTPTMLRLFTQLDELQALVTLSCCYHRMSQSECCRYEQFPMSDILHRVTADYSWHLSTYGLRLAAQETRSRWKNQSAADHLYHQNNVAFRATLDLVLAAEGIQLQKDRRKLVAKHNCVDFKTYVESVMSRIILDGQVDKESLKQSLLETYDNYKDIYDLIEPFTCLQVVLQGVLEAVILRDRVQYMLEQGLQAQLLPTMDDFISPRNMAIVAWKHSHT